MIQENYGDTFSSFINLFFNGREGKELELNRTLFELRKRAIDDQDKVNELANAIAKTISVLHGPEKSGKEKEITSINISISPIGDTPDPAKSKTVRSGATNPPTKASNRMSEANDPECTIPMSKRGACPESRRERSEPPTTEPAYGNDSVQKQKTQTNTNKSKQLKYLSDDRAFKSGPY